jgi:two-component system sensor histidine kinase RegB
MILRCLAMASQTILVLFVGLGLGYPIAYLGCFSLIAASALLNLAFAFSMTVGRSGWAWETGGQLAFDILQFAGLLYFTGGVVNPFCLLIIVPVTVAGATLPRNSALALTALALACVAMLAAIALPLPHPPGAPTTFGPLYRLACLVAIVGGVGFSSTYAVWVSAETARMTLALHVTETVLAREQRLSALGGLAAAAAHELGTPLATITVIAKELAREAPEGPLRGDAWLLVEQAQRCRDILKRLSETPETTDAVHERMSLLQLLREVLAAHAAGGPVRAEALVTGPPGMAAPDLWRRPEVLYALTTIVENAFDFAKAEILISARFDAESVSVQVRDDGPGFSPEVMARLGEPYVTSRPGGEGSRTGHVGLGLGFFIAKTLLERTGARVTFRNGRGGGAIVIMDWPRTLIEALEPAAERLEFSPQIST